MDLAERVVAGLPTLNHPTARGGGGVLSYITYSAGCAAQRGRDFEAPDLERGIHFRGVF